MTIFEDLLRRLDAAGLWSDVSAEQKPALFHALISGEDVTWAAGGAWRSDGEDLAGGDVEMWLTSMAAPLADCGVELTVSTIQGPFDDGSSGYSVIVNGTVLNLYQFAPDDPGVPASEDPWMDCTIQPVAEVNRLLDVAGSPCRIAIFWPGGNDGLAVLGDQSALHQGGGPSTPSGPWTYVIP